MAPAWPHFILARMMVGYWTEPYSTQLLRFMHAFFFLSFISSSLSFSLGLFCLFPACTYVVPAQVPLMSTNFKALGHYQGNVSGANQPTCANLETTNQVH